MANVSPGTAKLIKLMRRLNEATAKNSLDWEETDRPQGYAYSTPTSSVIVATKDDDGSIPYELQILNERGAVVDSLVSHRFSGEDEAWIEMSGGRELTDLYELVRRSAQGVDKAIDNLLESLPPASDEDPWN